MFISDPPVGEEIDLFVQNGSYWTFKCPFSPGNPSTTSFLWRRASDNATWDTQNLTLESVNYLIDDTDFICVAKNTMEPTIGRLQQGISIGRLHLAVGCEC